MLQIGVITALMNTNLRMGHLKHCLDSVKATGIIYGSELTDGKKYGEIPHRNEHDLVECNARNDIWRNVFL